MEIYKLNILNSAIKSDITTKKIIKRFKIIRF